MIRWTTISRPHPVIRLEHPDVLATLNSLGSLLLGNGETTVAVGRMRGDLAGYLGPTLAVLYEATEGRLTAVATDPFGATVWWRGEAVRD